MTPCWADHFIPYDIHLTFKNPHPTESKTTGTAIPDTGCACGCTCTSACAPDCRSCACVYFFDASGDGSDPTGHDTNQVPCHVDDYQPPVTVVSTTRNGWSH